MKTSLKLLYGTTTRASSWIRKQQKERAALAPKFLGHRRLGQAKPLDALGLSRLHSRRPRQVESLLLTVVLIVTIASKHQETVRAPAFRRHLAGDAVGLVQLQAGRLPEVQGWGLGQREEQEVSGPFWRAVYSRST